MQLLAGLATHGGESTALRSHSHSVDWLRALRSSVDNACTDLRRTTTDLEVRGPRMWPSVLNNWYRNAAFQAGTLPLAQFAGPAKGCARQLTRN